MPARFACLLLACTSVAAAQNRVWVDPLLGNNATGTNDPAFPFRTIAAAVNAIEALFPTDERFVLLQPGEYGATSGENFPIAPLAGTRLVGLGGSEQMRLFHASVPLVYFAAEPGRVP